MDYTTFKDNFSPVMPILTKAAPILAGYIGSPLTGVILAILGAVFETDPHDACSLCEKMHNDPDLYTKLASLDKTHAEWCKKNS